jgi:hypothetical protein
MDETKEWIFPLFLTVYYLTHEILLEFQCYFLFCLPARSRAVRVPGLCVLLTYQFLIMLARSHAIRVSGVQLLSIQFSRSFRRISYEFFGAPPLPSLDGEVCMNGFAIHIVSSFERNEIVFSFRILTSHDRASSDAQTCHQERW